MTAMARAGRRIAASWVALSLAVASLLVVVAPALAADPVEFGTPTASSTYGTSIVFKQPVDLFAPANTLKSLAALEPYLARL